MKASIRPTRREFLKSAAAASAVFGAPALLKSVQSMSTPAIQIMTGAELASTRNLPSLSRNDSSARRRRARFASSAAISTACATIADTPAMMPHLKRSQIPGC